MALGIDVRIDLDDSFARALPELAVPMRPSPVADPATVVVNEQLAAALGLDAAGLRTPNGAAILTGDTFPDGAHPVAQAYAGHQFGGYSPRLGDGRAVLLGEIVHGGQRHDLHLKGSGRTPFARGGDGRAALGPMLREYVMSEAMHALGIPTTRSLAVATTGEAILREARDGRVREMPGAVLARVAASHLRVGTFQYAAATGDVELLRRLTAYAIERHAPRAAGATHPSLALYEHVIEVQATLVASWMAVGFVHGVMNTDNMTISGETIDYGPCAFIDAYDPATVFSSIDHGGRYAYGNQPSIATWNLARLGEALLASIADEAGVTAEAAVELATEQLRGFPDRFHSAWSASMAAKLGLSPDDADTASLVADLLDLAAAERLDYTSTLRSLSSLLRGDNRGTDAAAGSAAFEAWVQQWRPRVVTGPDGLDRVNPVYVARNHLVEEALDAATAGDLDPFNTLVDVLSHPFDDRPGRARYAEPAPADFSEGYQTFCGT